MKGNTSIGMQSKAIPRRLPTECKICGASALYSYYGVIACSSCKVFFKRNAEKSPNHFKCVDENRCEINIFNRHICSYCRLKKCIASGMQVRMIRASRMVNNKNTNERKIQPIISTTRIEIPTLNLLRSDQSRLTEDQWTLLSNLLHCFDEYSGFAVAQRFIRQQSELPPKMRFKFAAIGELSTSMLGTGQLLYEKNVDFISLCLHDRLILLRNTMKYVSSLCSSHIARHLRLLDDPAIFKWAENMYGSSVLSISIRLFDQLDLDSTFIKLALALLTFSTINYTYYTNTPAENLINIRAVLYIQDKYTELIWRYLMYKYSHERAVLCFSNFIRCICLINNGIIEVCELQLYLDTMNSIVKQTENTLTLTK